MILDTISDQNRSITLRPYEVMCPNAADAVVDLIDKSTEPAAARTQFIPMRYDQSLLISQHEITNKSRKNDIWFPHPLVRVAIKANLRVGFVQYFRGQIILIWHLGKERYDPLGAI